MTPGLDRQQQVIALDHQHLRRRQDGEAVIDDILDLARIDRAADGIGGGLGAGKKIEEGPRLECMRGALVGGNAQSFELGLAHMEAIHGQQHGQARLILVEGGDEFGGERRLADARPAGKADGHALARAAQQIDALGQLHAGSIGREEF
jgi:hypothetical protein